MKYDLNEKCDFKIFSAWIFWYLIHSPILLPIVSFITPQVLFGTMFVFKYLIKIEICFDRSSI